MVKSSTARRLRAQRRAGVRRDVGRQELRVGPGRAAAGPPFAVLAAVRRHGLAIFRQLVSQHGAVALLRRAPGGYGTARRAGSPSRQRRSDRCCVRSGLGARPRHSVSNSAVIGQRVGRHAHSPCRLLASGRRRHHSSHGCGCSSDSNFDRIRSMCALRCFHALLRTSC